MIGLDIYRILCCLGVLVYHTIDDTFAYLGTVFNSSIAIYFYASFCVPGFFMLSGYLIVKEPLKRFDYYCKKILIIAGKLAGWVIFCCLINFLFANKVLNPFEQYIYCFYSKGILPVGWFLFSYMLLMFFAYPLTCIFQNSTVFSLIITSVLLFFISIPNRITFILLSQTQSLWIHLYLTYFIVGILIKQLSLKYTINSPYIIHLCIVGHFFALVYYFNTIINSEIFLLPESYYGSWFYSIYLITSFYLVSKMEITNVYLRRAVEIISNGTFVVYMMHLPILNLITRFYPINSLIKGVLVILFLFIGCEIMFLLLMRIPLLNKLI